MCLASFKMKIDILQNIKYLKDLKLNADVHQGFGKPTM